MSRIFETNAPSLDAKGTWGDKILKRNAFGQLLADAPVVNGVSILSARPDALMRSYCDALRAAITSLAKEENDIEAAIGSEARTDLLLRKSRYFEGRRHNLTLIEKYCEPMSALLDGCAERAAYTADWIASHHTGWNPEEMIPYFYQDWGGTPDFDEVRALLCGALERFSPDLLSVAVLGAGACGVVRSCAEIFDLTFGVDLAVPTLLLANGMLTGDSPTVYLEGGGWRSVELVPQPPAPNSIRLIAADVNSLPFVDGAMSAIVTQYLMDLMSDPLVTAREIRRVLKPGGVWINFSLPMKLPDEPLCFGQPALSELKGMLEPLGYEQVLAENRPFSLLNMRGLSPEADWAQQIVHYVVMRANEICDGKKGPAAPFGAYPSGDDWWRAVPRRMQARAVEIRRCRVFEVKGEENRTDIGTQGRFLSLPEEMANVFDALFSNVDGQRTNRQILEKMICDSIPITEEDYKSLIDILTKQHNVLSL